MCIGLNSSFPSCLFILSSVNALLWSPLCKTNTVLLFSGVRVSILLISYSSLLSISFKLKFFNLGETHCCVQTNDEALAILKHDCWKIHPFRKPLKHFFSIANSVLLWPVCLPLINTFLISHDFHTPLSLTSLGTLILPIFSFADLYLKKKRKRKVLFLLFLTKNTQYD